MKRLIFVLLAAFTNPVLAGPSDPDSFQWLEEVEGKRALDWVKARNSESLDTLKKDPRYADFLKESIAILTATDRIPYGTFRGGFVYNFWQDKKHVRGIWRRTTLESYRKANSKWDTIIDLDTLAKAEKKNWVYKGVSCLAPTYTRCLVRLSIGGKDASTYREYDLKTRTFVADGFVVPEAKSSADWVDQDTLLIGTNWGPKSLTKSGYPRVVKHWKRGTPLSSATTVYEGQESDVGVWPWVSHRPEGRIQMIHRADTFFTAEIYVLDQAGKTIKLPLQPSAKLHGVFKGQALISLRKPWTVNGKSYDSGLLLSTDFATLRSGKVGKIHTLYTPTPRSSVQGISMTKDDVYVSILDTVKGLLVRYQFHSANNRWDNTPVTLPKNGTLRVTSSNGFHNQVFINYEDFTTPDVLMSLSRNEKPTTLRSLPKRFDASGVVVEQHFAKSVDGTAVPYFLVKAKNAKLDGNTPTLLYGYGGFEISLTPKYMATFGKLWLKRGGAFAIANIRGGGEFGPRWHAAAQKENRQRAFDDFIGVANDLIARKLTSPKHLGIMGGSNGGLLVGVTFTQRPDLFNAVVCQVPLLDMLRYTKLLAGASWAAEYGDPDDPKMAKVIAKYSPYHNLDAKKTYPKVFFITSTRDDRVHPGHARKMAARMLAMGKPVHYFENIEGGHAASANQNQRAERKAMEFVYLWQQLGR